MITRNNATATGDLRTPQAKQSGAAIELSAEQLSSVAGGAQTLFQQCATGEHYKVV